MKYLRITSIKLAALSLMFFGQSLSAQVAIYPSQDSYTLSSQSSVNFGNEAEIKIKTSTSGANDRYGWLTFNTSSLNGNFEQVVLKLSQVNNTTANLKVETTTTSFNEDTINWSNQPTNISSINTSSTKEDSTLYIDVTDYVNSIINSTKRARFRISNTIITTPTIRLASKENSSISLRPQLIFLQSKLETAPQFTFTNTVVDVTDDNGFYNNQSWPSTLLNSTNGYSEEVDEYGGLVACDSNYRSTGYFRTQKIDGIWHLIDPLGNKFYTLGVNTVTKGGSINLPNDLIDLGVNTLGSWSDETIGGIPYCPRLNALVNFKNVRTDKSAWNARVLPVFESDFESFLDEKMPGWLAPYIGDPYVLGYFMDNELSFSGTQLEDSLGLTEGDAQFEKADAFMRSRHGNNYSIADITDEDEADYIGIVAEKYFSAVANAIRKVDSNHLILGSRIHSNVRYRPGVITAAGKYIDVLSINYYKEWEPQQAALDLWARYTDIPWFTTEFYTKASNSGLNNLDGAGWIVPTQTERAQHYENWVLRSMEDPNCVGLHWFRYNDDDTGSNKGLLNNEKTRYYAPLKNSFSQINTIKYALREQILKGSVANECNEDTSFSALFIPDPEKIYYIDNPNFNVRLAATANGAKPYTTSTATTGANVGWQFVSKGNGFWHIRRAASTVGRGLRSNNSADADMQAASSTGGWTYFQFSPGATDNTFHITLPEGPVAYKRLQITNTGAVKMVSSAFNGKWTSFRITEVPASSAKRLTGTNANFEMYPNPTSSKLTVSNLGPHKTIAIINMEGRTLKTITNNSNNFEVNVTDLAPGVYFVKVGFALKMFIKI